MESTNIATFTRQKSLVKRVGELKIKEKREIFAYIRTHPSSPPSVFLPYHGLTISEFAVAHVISTENKRHTTAAAPNGPA